VRAGGLSIAVAERVARALAKLRRHVDRPDGLIDGQDGEQALLGVIGHGVRTLVLQGWGGLTDDDARLTDLLTQLALIVERPVSQLARLEAGFVLLARHLEPGQLPGALALLVDALLPNELEMRAQDAHANRGLGLRRNDDGSGWRIADGELDLECGELLSAVLAAVAAPAAARRAAQRPAALPGQRDRRCPGQGRAAPGGHRRRRAARAAARRAAGRLDRHRRAAAGQPAAAVGV
jgi:hypothetical protein